MKKENILNWCAKNKKKNINVGGSLEKTKKYITDRWSEFMFY